MPVGVELDELQAAIRRDELVLLTDGFAQTFDLDGAGFDSPPKLNSFALYCLRQGLWPENVGLEAGEAAIIGRRPGYTPDV